MKKIIFLFVVVFLSSACSKQEVPWQRVGGEKGFKFAENLECEMLTSTDTSKLKESFRITELNSAAPKIEYMTGLRETLTLTPLQNGKDKIVLTSLSKERGARMYFLEKSTGVIGMAVSEDRKFDPKTEVAFRGNCVPSRIIPSPRPIQNPKVSIPLTETGSGMTQ